jgi:hypothetical protein
LTSSSSIRDAQLRRPFSQFLAYVAREMKLDTLSEDQQRTIAAGIADLEQTRRPPQLSHSLTELPIIVYAGRSLIGLTHGQTLRVNALYPGGLPARSVRARVTLHDVNGALLTQSAEATLERGGFHSFDFVRADIPASGEPVGRRLQVRVSLKVTAVDPSLFAHDPSAPGLFPTSIELVDNSTDRLTAVWLTTGFFEVVPPRKP